MSEATEFRADVAAWLAENCPEGARGPGQIASGSTKITLEGDVAVWLERMAERGWTVVLPRTPFTVPESLDPSIVRSAILDQSVLHAEPVADVTAIVTSRMNEL